MYMQSTELCMVKQTILPVVHTGCRGVVAVVAGLATAALLQFGWRLAAWWQQWWVAVQTSPRLLIFTDYVHAEH
jgi:hypothetical protein